MVVEASIGRGRSRDAYVSSALHESHRVCAALGVELEPHRIYFAENVAADVTSAFGPLILPASCSDADS